MEYFRLSRCLPHERYLRPENIFCKTPSQNPVFAAISEGILSLSMYLDIFHTHSSDTFFPTRAGRPCAMTVFNESDKHRPPMLVCNRQGDDGRDRIMILLERAGRKRRGGTPMDPIRCRASDGSKSARGRGQIGARKSKF